MRRVINKRCQQTGVATRWKPLAAGFNHDESIFGWGYITAAEDQNPASFLLFKLIMCEFWSFKIVLTSVWAFDGDVSGSAGITNMMVTVDSRWRIKASNVCRSPTWVVTKKSITGTKGTQTHYYRWTLPETEVNQTGAGSWPSFNKQGRA